MVNVRRVTLPDGRVIKIEGAPDYITDNELVAQFAPEFMQEEDEEESFFDAAKNFAADTGEWVEEKAESISEFGQAAVDTAQDFAESTASGFATVGENIMTAAGDVGSFVAGEDSDFVQFVRNKVEESREARDWVETRTADSPYASAIGEIAPTILGYVGGGSAIFQAGRAAGLSAFKSGVMSGIVTDQVLANREENIFSALTDPLDIEEGSIFADYFVTNPEEDSIVEQRLKLLVSDGLIFGGAIGLVLDTPLLGKIANNAFKKPWTALKESEKVDAVMSHMKEAKQKLWKNGKLSKEFMVENPNTGELEPIQPSMAMEPPPPEQVLEQNSSFFRRMWQIGFTKEGWRPPEVFNAFEEAQAAKRMLNERAENISNRLAISLKDISSEYPVETKDAVNDLMFNRFHWLDAAEVDEKDIAKFSKEYNLPESAVEEIVNARELIDRLSKTITNSDVIDDELRDVIENNIGTYFNRSYRLFEDNRWMPDNTLYQDTLNKYTADLMKQNPKLSLQDAANTARDRLEDLLSQGAEDTIIDSHITNIRKLNKDVLTKRKEIPEYLRKFMGEIDSPAERLMITVQKLSEFSENAKFFDAFVKEGKKSGYVADEATGIFTTKITGTKFPGLDGLYTTPEIASAVEGRQGRLLSMMTYGGKNPVLNRALHNFFAMKGFSQKTKTVYSHVTHLRNFLGGMQFGLANGSNPFAEGTNSFSILKNQIKNMGDKELDEMYEEFLEMGLINTNVRVQEFRKLLQEGENYFLDKQAGKFAGYLQKSSMVGDKTIRAIDKVSDFTEQLYMATDDFFKINGYFSELDTLKAAYPDANIADLKKEAAGIIRDTYPSYDRVSPLIKGLRELPLGNFVAFPAEILRNSYHIIKRGFTEVVSDNEIIRARGMRRLAGYVASASAWTGASYATAAFAGLTEEEKKAMAKVSEAPWTSGEPLYFRDKDTGELAVVDTTSLNSYNYVRGIFSEPIARILKGEMTNEAFEETARAATWDFIKHTTGPFVEPSMFTDGFRAVGEALASPTGETLDGRKLFPPGMPMDDMIYKAFEEVVKPFVPGSYYSIKPFFNLEKLDEVSGLPKKTLGYEVITNLSGVKFTRVDPQANLIRKAYQYQKESKSKYNMFVSYDDTPEDVITRYIDMQQQEYRLQRNLYEHYKATETLLGTREAYKLLRDAGFSKERATQFRRGFFTPTSISKNKIRSMREKVYSVDKEFDKSDHPQLLSLVRELKRLGYAMSRSSLESFDETEEGYTEGARMLRAEGGLVTDPAMRRDPYTGRPYAATAEDLIDPLQRLGFVQGGYVRQQYSLGGSVIKGVLKATARELPKTLRDKSIFRASESLAAQPLTREELYQPIKISFMADNIQQGRGGWDDETASLLGDEHTIFDMTDPAAAENLKAIGYEPQEGSAFVAIRKKGDDEEIPMFFQDEDEILEFYNKGVGNFDSLRGAKHSEADAEFSKSWREEEDIFAYPFINPKLAATWDTDLDEDFIETVALGLYDEDDILNFVSEVGMADKETIDFLKENIRPVSKDMVRRVKLSEPEGITVYHGSSADFDEFSREFDFTGEGNQAYGAGAYLTDTRDIAKSYRDLASFKNAKDAPEDSIARSYTDEFDMTDQDAFLEQIDMDVVATTDIPGSKMKFFEMKDGSAIVHQPSKKKEPFRAVEMPPQGTLYEARINVKEDEILDLNEKLYKSEKGRKLISDYYDETDEELLNSITGHDLIDDARGVGGTNEVEKITDEFRKAGFKVLKYKDGFSRGKEGGTYNYVVFDPKKDVTILKNNGENAFKKKFLRGSTHKQKVFRSSWGDEPTTDLLIAIQNPREMGVHVGANAGQSNVLMRPGIQKYMKDLEAEPYADTAPILRQSEYEEAFESVDPDTAYGSVERPTRQAGANLAQYYINIKNPLKVDTDIGRWGAEDIVPLMRKLNPSNKPQPIKVVRTMSRKLNYYDEFAAEGDEMGKIVNDYIVAKMTDDTKGMIALRSHMKDNYVDVDAIDQKITEFSEPVAAPDEFKGGQVFKDSIESNLDRKLTKEEWDSLDRIYVADEPQVEPSAMDLVKYEAQVYKSNREFREWLQDLGFDSIEYKNTGEASFEGADQRSWILFDHSQIKSVNAESFDITDPRVSKSMGGLVRNRDKYAEGGMVPMPPEVMQPEAQEIINPPLNQSNLQAGEQSDSASMSTGLIMRSLKRRFR